MKKLRPGEMIQIKTVEELLGVVNEESAILQCPLFIAPFLF